MASTESQRKAHRFLSERLRDHEAFSIEELQRAAGWDKKTTADTYVSKQFRFFFEKVSPSNFRVTEAFRPYLDWKKFCWLVTQVKRVTADYKPTVYDQVIVYEFYIPLTHESALRTNLDSLFYKDELLSKLRGIDLRKLQDVFPTENAETPEPYFERICRFIESKFQGYSMYHVDGRFRTEKLSTTDGAADIQKAGTRYLIDETTAVTRFIFPCDEDEAPKVRFLFETLFIRSLIQSVLGEDQIWMVESGIRNRVHIWKPGNDGDRELPL